MARKTFGRYLCADPKVCQGQITFRGTRILVSDVLELVASGIPWQKITEECHGAVSRRAIADAIRYAGRILDKQGPLSA
jgi:uncharacterized protein (DUF433 family)